MAGACCLRAAGVTQPWRGAGLDMAKHEMHTSGHPVPWDVDRGARHRELVSMLHVRHGDYAHWAVRIDRASRRITHISAGPVVKSLDFRNEVPAPRQHRSLRSLLMQEPAVMPARLPCMLAGLPGVGAGCELFRSGRPGGARRRPPRACAAGAAQRSACLRVPDIPGAAQHVQAEGWVAHQLLCVQVLYGEGDRFGCVLNIPTGRIAWCAPARSPSTCRCQQS